MKMKGKKTMILVTHQISYMYGCDKVVIIEDGRVTEFEQPDNLREKLSELQMIENKNKTVEEEEEERIKQKTKEELESMKKSDRARKSSIALSDKQKNEIKSTPTK